jgi:hypothetical protein
MLPVFGASHSSLQDQQDGLALSNVSTAFAQQDNDFWAAIPGWARIPVVLGLIVVVIIQVLMVYSLYWIVVGPIWACSALYAGLSNNQAITVETKTLIFVAAIFEFLAILGMVICLLRLHRFGYDLENWEAQDFGTSYKFVAPAAVLVSEPIAGVFWTWAYSSHDPQDPQDPKRRVP